MALSILTSKLQVIKTLKDHEYIQRLKDHDYMQTIHNAKRKITEGIQIGQSDNDQKNNRKSRAQLIRLSAAVCGIELCYSAETAFVSPILLKLGVPVQLMTLVWCLSPLLGLILVPVMGSLSDRCPLKLGRRRPFILIFSAGCKTCLKKSLVSRDTQFMLHALSLYVFRLTHGSNKQK